MRCSGTPPFSSPRLFHPLPLSSEGEGSNGSKSTSVVSPLTLVVGCTKPNDTHLFATTAPPRHRKQPSRARAAFAAGGGVGNIAIRCRSSTAARPFGGLVGPVDGIGKLPLVGNAVAGESLNIWCGGQRKTSLHVSVRVGDVSMNSGRKRFWMATSTDWQGSGPASELVRGGKREGGKGSL